MVAPASKGLIPQPVLMSAFKLRKPDRIVKRNNRAGRDLEGAVRRFRRPKCGCLRKIHADGVDVSPSPQSPLAQFNRIASVHQRSIIAGLSTLSLTGVGRFGMITTGAGTTITMPPRAGRV